MTTTLDKLQGVGLLSAVETAVEAVHYCECCGAPSILTPTLVCVGCHHRIDVKAYVYEKRGAYYAECLTLNLISRGTTQEEAIKRLQGAMFSYVDAVLGGGGPVKGLIPDPLHICLG